MPYRLYLHYFALTLIIFASHSSAQSTEITAANPSTHSTIEALCDEIGNKLGSVSVKNCLQQELLNSGYLSTEKRARAYKEYLPVKGKQPLGKVLLMGGIHGDEY